MFVFVLKRELSYVKVMNYFAYLCNSWIVTCSGQVLPPG